MFAIYVCIYYYLRHFVLADNHDIISMKLYDIEVDRTVSKSSKVVLLCNSVVMKIECEVVRETRAKRLKCLLHIVERGSKY